MKPLATEPNRQQAGHAPGARRLQGSAAIAPARATTPGSGNAVMPADDKLLCQLPSEDWNRLEQVLQEFEAALRRGEHPALEDYLPQGQADSRPLLIELIHLDLEHRLKAGEP